MRFPCHKLYVTINVWPYAMLCDEQYSILMYESMEWNEHEYDYLRSISRVTSPILVGCSQEVVFLRDH